MTKKITNIPCCVVPGDTIGVLAPASPFDIEKFNKGLTLLKSMGFEIDIPPGLFSSKGYLAGEDDHRAELLNNAFKTAGIKAIICARGGFGSLRILERIDYNAVFKNPKLFVGFSDISSLLTVFYEKSGLSTIHGPTVTSLADADTETVRAFFSILTSDKVQFIHNPGAISLKPGVAKGPVIGGNLTTICHMVGTPFEPDFSGHILFLEDRGEAPYRIDRMLTQMKMAGCFKKLYGLVLGSFSECGDIRDVIKVFQDCFAGAEFPILSGIKAGHEQTNIALPIGIEATLNSNEKYLCYHSPSTVSKENQAGCSMMPEYDQMNYKKTFCLNVHSSNFYQIDQMMAKAIKQFVFPGAVLLFSKNGRLLFHKAYGIRSVFSNRSVTLNTVFDLASLTKPLATATSVMTLVRDGKIALEDRLGQLLAEFNNSEMHEIRIGHLLSHTSGLNDYYPYFKMLEKFPTDLRKFQLKQYLVNTPLKNPIGRKTLYSDLGFMILSWITELKAGCRMDGFITEEIFKPLGLENLFYQDLHDGYIKEADYAATEICSWRKTLIEGIVHDENAYAVGGIEGHAGLFGTADNVHRLLEHLLTIYHDGDFKGLFPRDLVKRFLRRSNGFDRPLGFDAPSEKKSSSGHLFSMESVGHLGFTGTSFWMDLPRSIIVILLTNRIHPDRNNEKIKKFRPELHDLIMEKIMNTP